MRKANKDQMTVAGAIYGIIGLIFLCLMGLAIHAVFTTYNPAFVPMSAIFGIIGFAATFTSWYCFRKAMRTKL